MSEFKNIVEKSEGFYLDWECACNLCEDEFGGSTFDWYVRDWMLSHGWTDEDLAQREDLFLVRSMAKGLQDLAARGTHHDTNPTRRIAHGNAEWQEADTWWVRYLHSADDAVRRRAKLALRVS